MARKLLTELKRAVSAYRNALRPRPVRIVSPLTVEEASRRLRDGLARRRWVAPAPWVTWRWALRGFTGDKEPERIVTGSVSSRIRLTAFVPGVRNSWRPTFRGRLQARDGAAELVGSFGFFPGVRAFSLFWAGGVAVFGLVALIVTVVMLAQGKWDDARTAGFLLVVGVGMLLFGLVLNSGASRLGDRDEQWLSRWLEDRLDA